MITTDSGEQQPVLPGLPPKFGPGFLADHAGKIISNPKIAIVELVANCWDAGADTVKISWPDEIGGTIVIEDDGEGLSSDEFNLRWPSLSYNRRENQGDVVSFPKGNQSSNRKAFGRNGKGRHGLFAFSDNYQVSSRKAGFENIYNVTRISNAESPFRIQLIQTREADGHGLSLDTKMEINQIEVSDLKDLLGSKFIVDPSFKIYVNDDLIDLTDLHDQNEPTVLEIEGFGQVLVRHIVSEPGRTSKQHGVAWWVNRRLVLDSSWRGIDDIPFIDARSTEAKRHTFIVEADLLEQYVEPSWDGFIPSDKVDQVTAVVNKHIKKELQGIFKDIHKQRKKIAISQNVTSIQSLSTSSQTKIGQFIDELQIESATITQKDLNATVQIFTNLERSESKYYLLQQLAQLGPDDLDELSTLLSKWSIREACLILDVLGERLHLIENLERLMDDPGADELHQIQPLIQSGLWIFGPEYESIEYVSNRSLLKVITEFFQGKGDKLTTPSRRPDIVATPNSSISLYTTNSFDENREVDGIASILIIELKRGGYMISTEERRQAEDYAKQLRLSGQFGNSTKILGFVLGSSVDQYTDRIRTDNDLTEIIPRPFSIVLQQAKARTHNLYDQIKKIKEEDGINLEMSDPDIEAVLANTAENLPLNFL